MHLGGTTPLIVSPVTESQTASASFNSSIIIVYAHTLLLVSLVLSWYPNQWYTLRLSVSETGSLQLAGGVPMFSSPCL